jgi:RNA polymerase sigma-70 factor (ECF subfamily)
MKSEVQAGGAAEAADWIARIARGDRNAFERMYAVYAPRIFRFVVRMVRDETRSEEIVNDVMVEVWKSASRFEGRSSPSTWVLGIARHRALNALRGGRLDTRPLDEGVEVCDPGEDAEVTADKKSMAVRLRAALDALSPEHREVVELTFFQGCSYKEIAAIARCPENTVKTRMFHAKKKLKPLLVEARLEGEAT